MTSGRDHRLQELVRRAREGEASDFRKLVRVVFDRLQRWAIGHTGSRDAADEVTQRVLIILHRRLDSYDGRGRFESWLYRITRNAAFAYMREAKRHVRLDENLPARSDMHPVERLHTERAAELVRVLFEQLPARQREVFDLVDLQGREISEVAAMLELSPSTVRVHLHRARSAIRTEILARHPEFGRVAR